MQLKRLLQCYRCGTRRYGRNCTSQLQSPECACHFRRRVNENENCQPHSRTAARLLGGYGRRLRPGLRARQHGRPRVSISKCHYQGELAPIPPRMFRPSTDWTDAGPIIEPEHIDLISDFGQWMARHSKREDYSRADASPLVAAMRAYLMWEYGDEVPSSDE